MGPKRSKINQNSCAWMNEHLYENTLLFLKWDLVPFLQKYDPSITDTTDNQVG